MCVSCLGHTGQLLQFGVSSLEGDFTRSPLTFPIVLLDLLLCLMCIVSLNVYSNGEPEKLRVGSGEGYESD